MVVPKPSPYPIYIPPPPAVPSSLEGLLNFSQVIVRGWVAGAEVRTERVSPSRWEAKDAGVTVDRLMPGCAAILQVRFNITEYLKGFGPHQILIEDNLGHRRNMPTVTLPYLTDGEARAAAWAWWNAQDGDPRRKESVLFIRELTPDGVARVSLRSSAVDPIVRHWVPLTDEISPSPASQDAGAPRFYTESGPPGEGETPVVMPLAELRSRIAAFDALLAKGSGVDGYRECIETTIAREKLRRQDKIIHGPDYESRTYTRRDQMPSGLPAGAGIDKYRQTLDAYYANVWLDGPDHRHFTSETVDDDDSAANGYYTTIATERPLPAGTYRFSERTQRYEETLCDFTVNGYAISPYTERWIVEVAPSVEGTLHEAFFDPTASDGSIGASAADGGLSPAEFSVDGEANAVESLRWRTGLIALDASNPAALIGYEMDVILPDASVSLTLAMSDAKLDTERGALTWDAPSPPWREGDKLMLRIRNAGPVPPAPAPRPWVPAALNLTAAAGAPERPEDEGRGVAILEWKVGDGAGGAKPELQQWFDATEEWGDLISDAQPDPISVAHGRTDAAIYGLTPGNSYSYRVRFAHCYYQGLNCYEIEHSDWAYVSITIPAPADGAAATPTPLQ